MLADTENVFEVVSTKPPTWLGMVYARVTEFFEQNRTEIREKMVGFFLSEIVGYTWGQNMNTSPPRRERH